MGIFDIALEKRFTDSDELVTINVTGSDSLLIRDSETGAVMRVSFSTLASAIANAFSSSFASLVDGKVPSAQLPSYIDDVLEYATASNFPATGEAGKIYVALDTNLTYRWSGSAYVEISKSLALGETSSTAYRGDRGKTAYDHSQTSGNPHGTSKADVGLGNVDNTSDATKNSATATLENKTLSSPVISGIADVSGGRLKFPATQVPSTDLNTLDDYKEGSFTPLLSCSTSNPTVTYSLQRGEYVKIGKFVQCTVYLSWSAVSGGTGNIRVNLPFEIDSSVGTSPGGVITRMRGLTIPSSRVWSQVEGIHGANLVQITGMLNGNSTVILDASAFTAQIGELCFNICYRASS